MKWLAAAMMVLMVVVFLVALQRESEFVASCEKRGGYALHGRNLLVCVDPKVFK